MRVVYLVCDFITCLDVLTGESSQKPQGSNDSTACDLLTFALVDMAHPVGLPFPGLLSLTGVSLPWQWSNKIIGITNAGYQLLSRAVGAHVQRGFIGTDQPRLRSPSWRATAPMGESVPWGTWAGLTKICGRDSMTEKAVAWQLLWQNAWQRIAGSVNTELRSHCAGTLYVLQLTSHYLNCNCSGFMRTWQHVKNRRNVKEKINTENYW